MCQKLAADRNQGRQNWDLPVERKVDRTRGENFKLHQGKFRLGIVKNFLIEMVVKH